MVGNKVGNAIFALLERIQQPHTSNKFHCLNDLKLAIGQPINHLQTIDLFKDAQRSLCILSFNLLLQFQIYVGYVLFIDQRDRNPVQVTELTEDRRSLLLWACAFSSSNSQRENENKV